MQTCQELWIQNILDNTKDDIEIQCDDGSIKMNRFLLESQSEVFKTMLNSSFQESSKDVILKDVKMDVLSLVDEVLKCNKKRSRELIYICTFERRSISHECCCTIFNCNDHRKCNKRECSNNH